jgi:hypothetical protein
MKSTSPITIQPKHSDQEKSRGARRLHLPLTDYSFQPTSTELHAASAGSRTSRPVIGPAFRDLSDQFLGAETKRSYAVEAAFFAIIVAVSAWPIASMVRALSQLLR